MTERNQSQNFLSRIGNFITSIVVAIWTAITTIFKGIWQIVLKLLDFVAQLLKIIAKFIRSIFLGVAAIIVSIGILVFAIGGAFYLIGAALGLDESKNLETTRELLIKAPTKWIGEEIAPPISNDPLIKKEEVNVTGKVPMVKMIEDMPESCEVDDDCPLPMEYAVRSNCAYEAQCVEGKCEVICPEGSTDTDLK